MKPLKRIILNQKLNLQNHLRGYQSWSIVDNKILLIQRSKDLTYRLHYQHILSK